MKQASRQLKKNLLRPLPVTLLILLLLVTTITVLELTDTTTIFHDRSIPADSTISEHNKGERADEQKNSNEVKNEPGNSTSKAVDTPEESISLIKPSGNFVSSHVIGLSEGEVSTCNTTPGAKCTIVFMRGDQEISLMTKTVDSGGAAYWNWTPRQIGLTGGEWSIKATATLGSQQLSTTDALKLRVD